MVRFGAKKVEISPPFLSNGLSHPEIALHKMNGRIDYNNRAIAFKKILYQEKKIGNRQKKVYFLKKLLRNPS